VGGSNGEESRRSTSTEILVCGSGTAEACKVASSTPVASHARLTPEARVGEKACPALRVVNDRDFHAPVAGRLPARHPAAEVGEVGDVFDDGLGDASPSVAQNGGVAELESQGDRGVDPVVETGDHNHLRSGHAQWHRSVGVGEFLVVLEQWAHPGGHLRFLSG